MVVSGNAKLLKVYHNRKAGLFKKVRELSTLCDVKACIIAYAPNSAVPETWPADPSTVVQLIQDYKIANEEVCGSKKKKVIPPPSDKGLDGCSPELLRRMMTELDERIKEARSWMQILKGGEGGEEKLEETPMNFHPMPLSYVPAAAPTMMSEWFPLLDQNQVMYADGGYYANGMSSNSLGFASEGFANIQCGWQCRVPLPL